MKELGPYSYRYFNYFNKNETGILKNWFSFNNFRETRYKNIQNGTSDFSVYYRENREYYFSRETTPPELNLDDVIFTPNPIYMVRSIKQQQN